MNRQIMFELSSTEATRATAIVEQHISRLEVAVNIELSHRTAAGGSMVRKIGPWDTSLRLLGNWVWSGGCRATVDLLQA